MRRILCGGLAVIMVAGLLGLAPEASAVADFPDVPSSHPFYDEIMWMAESGITTGYPDGTFRPGDAVTRQSMAAFMQRLYDLLGGPAIVPGDPGFPDVALSHPFYDEIAWMAESGITTGFPDGTFRPNEKVTRQSMAAFMQRLSDLLGGPVWSGANPGFPDVPASHPFFDEIAWMAESGVTAGFPDGNFRPSAPVTRQSMAAFMQRLNDLLDGGGTIDDPPPVDDSTATNLDDAGEFLYTGPDAVQKDVDPDAFEPARSALIRGKVVDQAGAALAGVRVEVLDHPEYGYTESRSDGVYDLAVNGGGSVVLDFTRSGRLPAQRDVQVGWQEWTTVDDVALLPLDPAVTNVEMASPEPFQAVVGSTETDVDGTRQGVLLVPAGTDAVLVAEDGTETPAADLDVRITEYTVGDMGPEAMPGELPPSSGYTYAFELSADEAIAVDAVRVEFDQPLPYYTDNFLDFPVGTDVPLGYYDREMGEWVPEDDGRVISVVSEAGGKADLDVNGDGVADTGALLTDLGITDAERTEIATRYAPDDELWRVQVDHFTPWDCNWPYGPPADAKPPVVGPPVPPTKETPPQPTHDPGKGTVSVEDQSLTEALPIPGTPLNIAYNSQRTSGSQTMEIPITGPTALPASATRVDLTVTVAGRTFRSSHPTAPNQTVEFTWDGKDAFGRPLMGAQRVGVDIANVYEAVYMEPASFTQSFGAYTGIPISESRARSEVMLHRTFTTTLQVWDARGEGLGGWTIDAHHSYDPLGKTLHMGTGADRQAENLNADVFDTVAGTGACGTPVDGVAAIAANICQPLGLDVGPDGSVYFTSDEPRVRVWRVDPDGILHAFAGGPPPAMNLRPRRIAIGPDGVVYLLTGERVYSVASDGATPVLVAGSGEIAYSGDGGPATAAGFFASDIAVGPDGSIYISDKQNNRVRRVGTNGIIQTVAGNGQGRPGGLSTDVVVGDGGPATAAPVWPQSIAVDGDGVLYISSQANIRRVGPDGIITTVAGNGVFFGHSGDGGPATAAGINAVSIKVGSDDAIYFGTGGGYDSKVRKVSADGTISTVAGREGAGGGFTPDNFPLVGADSNGLDGVAFGPDGDFYFTDRSNHRIRKAADPFPGFDGSGLVVADSSGDELFRFDPTGRHLSTESALTGAPVVDFVYDSAGRVSSVDVEGAGVTTFAYAADGHVTITGPDGAVTALTVDAAGWLDGIAGPSGWNVDIDHQVSGLLDSVTTPDGATFGFTWAKGRVVSATDANGGVTTYTRSELPRGHSVVQMTPGGTVTTTSELLADGSRKQAVTQPDGSVNQIIMTNDGTQTSTGPTGQTVVREVGPDPRFGLDVPVVTTATVQTPGGKKGTIQHGRTATFDDPLDLTTLDTLTDTVTVDGHTNTKLYDVDLRTLTETTAEGRVTTTVFDPGGRMLSSDPPGALAPFVYTYDSRGRPTQIRQDGATDRVWALAYDTEDNLASVTDPLGRKTTFAYDGHDRMTTQTMPGSRVLGFGYDADGMMTSLTPPSQPAHEWDQTDTGQIAGYRPPAIVGDDGSATSAYRGDRTPATFELSDGTGLTYTYDALNRLLTLAEPGRTVTYGYAPTSGNLASTSTGVETVAFSYDGTLLTGQTWSGVTAGTVGITYHQTRAPLPASWTVAGTEFAFAYDDDALLTGVGAETLDRNAGNGHVDGITLGVIDEDRAIDEFGDSVSQDVTASGSPVYSSDLVRDALGRITSDTVVTGGHTTVTATEYDAASRVTKVTTTIDGGAPSVKTFTYDTNGNLLTGAGITGTAVYDDRDRLDHDGSASYEYGPNGAVVARTEGADVTTYDTSILGALEGVTLPDGTAIDYTLDGDGRRVARSVDGIVTHRWLYYDGLRPAAELDGAGTVRTRFVYGSKKWVPDYLVKDGVTYRVISDSRGSVRMVIDTATGAVAQRLGYDTYGNVTTDTSPGFQPFGFAGGLIDPDTGLLHFAARDYDPTLGRYLAADPAGFARGSTNQYIYANANPVNIVDPGGATNTKPEAIADLLYALAWEEERIGGWANMVKAYGTVDCAEHALFGDAEVLAPAVTGPGFGKWTAWEFVEEAGGRFLPKRDHDVKLKDGSIIDMRWFIQGYLSSLRGSGLTNSYFKIGGGILYNFGKGYYRNAPQNASINDRSVMAGAGWAAAGYTLQDFANMVSSGPPPTNSYRGSYVTHPWH